MTEQSTIFPIFLRAEYRDTGGIQRFQSDAQRAAQAAKREFEGVGAALDAALSRQRNQSGSLDLGVDELRQAAAAQKQRAIAARELADATLKATNVDGKYVQSLGGVRKEVIQNAIEEERLSRELDEKIDVLGRVQAELNETASATDLVTEAGRRGTTARGNVINSARAERTAFIQLGQQLQDMTIQAQLGTNAFVIMSQQLPQAAFALSGLEGSANKTKAAIGGIATFLSRPWGAAIFAATALLGPFIAKTFESGEAADASTKAQRTLSEVLDDTRASYNDVTAALRDYIRTQEKAREVTLLSLKADAEKIASNLRKAISIREEIKAELDLQASREFDGSEAGDSGAFVTSAQAIRVGAIQARQAEQDARILELQTAANLKIREVARGVAAVNTDAAERIKLGFDVLRKEAEDSISNVDQLIARLTQLNRAEDAALDQLRGSNRSGSQSRQERENRRRQRELERIQRERQQLERFSDQSRERVTRTDERFGDQPRLIEQALRATRELDALIAEIPKRTQAAAASGALTKELRLEFATVIDDAIVAKRTIEESLQRPFEDLRLESERRLEIERLLSQGRVDEAAGLQAVLEIEQQLGDEVELRAKAETLMAIGRTQEAEVLTRFLRTYSELKEEARDRAEDEQRVTRELRAQRDLLEAQVDVAATVADELQSVLSGRPTDFIRNIQQSLLDLQGARLFEDLFGPEFRDLQEELRGNTPQARANRAYTSAVNETALQTERAANAASQFADAVGQAAARVSGVAANDNPVAADGGITVEGRTQEVNIDELSIRELADRMAEGIVTPLTGELEDLLGPKFAGQLGGVIKGAVAGLVVGGTPGAVLGGLQEAVGSNTALGGLLSIGVSGTQRGTEVAGIANSLGLGFSTGGAQFGGGLAAALGKFIPIPGGSVLGAVAGGILGAIGSLFSGAPRGSATIGNVGGSLGITGVRGNKSELRDAASGLGQSVLDAIDNIAEELDATVNASAGRVSIGQRKDEIRVDFSGRGEVDLSRGAVSFGDDAEAAVRAATQDLIKDGVIAGLTASENRLLQAGRSIEQAIKDVLDFRSVFDRLEEIRDPVGFAVRQLNEEFEDLIDLFNRAGASSEEFADLEELYNLERARAIEETTDRIVGSLQSLLNDLTIGDSGLSLRSRRANALEEFNSLAARVEAGDSSAFDDFADISQQLLEIERQLFGSTQSYFDRLSQVTALTEQAMDGQTNVQALRQSQPSPFQRDFEIEIDRSIDIMNADVSGWLRAINDNIIYMAGQLNQTGFGGGRTGPANIANF